MNKINNISGAFTTSFAGVSLLAVLLVLLSSFTRNGVDAFSPVTTPGSASTTSSLKETFSGSHSAYYARNPLFFFQRGESKKGSRLYSSNDEKESDEKNLYPALSREEVSTWLSSVEIYALMTTGGEDGSDERIHLLYGPDGSAVTYFFISSEAATTMASQLKQIGAGDLSTMSLSLGKVWFGLLDPQGADRVEGVDYRLVPDPRDLNGAKELLTELASADSSCSFLSPFNEIPTFLDVRMRIPGSEVVDDKPVEQLPVYLGLQNIIQASENMKAAEDSSPTSLSATINVADLNDLVKQMQQESTIDFRQSLLVPPTDM